MYWQKLRKRWIWHRLIKHSLKIGHIIYLKKYFAFNIAMRKNFLKILPTYELHKKILYQQVPYFLVNVGLVPVIKQAVKLCKFGKVMVNGAAVGVNYIIRPFDLIRFNFRKNDIDWKYRRFTSAMRFNFKFKRGLIYNWDFKMYIFYRNLDLIPGRGKVSYLYHYYFYRNLLQTCRMR